MTATELEGWLTTADVAARLGVAQSTVRSLASLGTLPPTTRVGRTPLWSEADLEAYAARRRAPGRPRRASAAAPSEGSGAAHR